MLLTLTTTHAPARDLGHLLGKHPDRVFTRDLGFGRATVLFPEADDARCTAALILDVDPVRLVRGGGDGRGDAPAEQYVGDRPYAASSFLSVAIGRVLGSALNGRSSDRPALAAAAIPLDATVRPLPCRIGRDGGVDEDGNDGAGADDLPRRLFAPLGYAVEAEGSLLDAGHPGWGPSPYVTLTLRKTCRLAELLTHLYVLVPVLDDAKHYVLGEDEVAKLLAKGGGWLEAHPERDLIVRRYLRRRPLVREALARLASADAGVAPDEAKRGDAAEAVIEQPLRLHDRRLDAVADALRAAGAARVLDLGCGGGRLIERLLRQGAFAEVVGVDAEVRALETASRRLRLDEMAPAARARVRLLHGALTYKDDRLRGFDAAALVEVIEHLDPPRLPDLERAVFGHARPGSVVVTTPNREHNALFPRLPAGRFRHPDHRFEWTRAEFRAWAGGVANRFGYRFTWHPVGEDHPAHGPPGQMAVFVRCA